MIEPILIGMSKSVHRWRGKLKSKIWFTSAIAQVDAQQGKHYVRSARNRRRRTDE